MKLSSRWMRGLAILSLFAVLALGLVAIATPPAEAKGGPCVCPMIYAPVICAKGKIYPNQCVADCRNAKDCVPLGVLD